MKKTYPLHYHTEDAPAPYPPETLARLARALKNELTRDGRIGLSVIKAHCCRSKSQSIDAMFGETSYSGGTPFGVGDIRDVLHALGYEICSGEEDPVAAFLRIAQKPQRPEPSISRKTGPAPKAVKEFLEHLDRNTFAERLALWVDSESRFRPDPLAHLKNNIGGLHIRSHDKFRDLAERILSAVLKGKKIPPSHVDLYSEIATFCGFEIPVLHHAQRVSTRSAARSHSH